MTGFGAAEQEREGVQARAECRSVNSRFLEIRLKLPASLSAHEAEFKRRIGERIRRGRVEVAVSVRSEQAPAGTLRVNPGLAAQYISAARDLSADLAVTGEVRLSELLRLPGVIELEPPASSSAEAETEGLLGPALACLEAALSAHETERVREGERLTADLSERVASIESSRAEIARLAAGVPGAARDRLRERISRLAPDAPLEPGRLETEIALLADRSDVTEELVRLESHLQAARALIAGDGEPAGKRFEFLLQEFQRETNTINSKSTDLGITRHALAIKAEVEKMREQAQNLE